MCESGSIYGDHTGSVLDDHLHTGGVEQVGVLDERIESLTGLSGFPLRVQWFLSQAFCTQ
jgi:hypothetical protein